VLRQFEPDVILVSAGFDAHDHDPLGGMRLSTAAFGAMTAALRAVADECCLGRVVAVAEGGYDLEALAASLDASILALSDRTVQPAWPASSITSARGREAVQAAQTHLRGFWKL